MKQLILSAYFLSALSFSPFALGMEQQGSKYSCTTILRAAYSYFPSAETVKKVGVCVLVASMVITPFLGMPVALALQGSQRTEFGNGLVVFDRLPAREMPFLPNCSLMDRPARYDTVGIEHEGLVKNSSFEVSWPIDNKEQVRKQFLSIAVFLGDVEKWPILRALGLNDILANKQLYLETLGADVLLQAVSYLPAHSASQDDVVAAIRFCLNKGASAQRLDLRFANTPETLHTLKRLGARCSSDPETETLVSEFNEGDIDHLFLQPQLILEQKYKNLGARESAEAKIPYIVHHIWLTSPESPKELRPQDLQNAIRIKKLYASSDTPWTHIVWTNDPSLIAESAKTLESEGLEVRSIADHPDLRLLYLVDKFIETKEWGKASDTLRYALLEKFGGIYADINYNLTRLLNSEAHKYNFFTSTWGGYYIENYFFGASPNHPVIKRILHLVERNMVSPPEYISKLDPKSRTVTDMGTANPTFVAYYLEANKNGNIDVVYPQGRRPQTRVNDSYESYSGSDSDSESEDPYADYYNRMNQVFEQECGSDFFDEFNRYLDRNEISGAPELHYGEDSTDGLTWLNK